MDVDFVAGIVIGIVHVKDKAVRHIKRNFNYKKQNLSHSFC